MINDSLLLRALRCENERRPPVWLMRQAGRYLPEYRKIREKYSLWQMFHTPEIATEVTLQPIDILGVDAAIIFSDILVVGEAIGGKVQFVDGKSPSIELGHESSSLDYVAKAIKLVKAELKVPLIGFCGGPFTVASYIAGANPKDHTLLEKITQASIAYLQMQVDAGADVIQIFDSWANKLTSAEFLEYCVPYLKKMVQSLPVPVIVFCRGSCIFVEELIKLKPACISFDSQMPLCELDVPEHIAVQGNLDPSLLYAPQAQIKEHTQKLLHSMRGRKGFIVNLGHGILPDMDVSNVKCLVDTVRLS